MRRRLFTEYIELKQQNSTRSCINSKCANAEVMIEEWRWRTSTAVEFASYTSCDCDYNATVYGGGRYATVSTFVEKR